MKKHLEEFTNRLKSYSKQLNNFTILLEQPWVTTVDDKNSRCVFIFRRENNDLLMSLNGKVEKAKWEYIASMNSLLIERKNETILYNQGFLDESIMILRRDGTDEFQLFTNENKISSTIEKLLEEIENKYLQRSTIKKKNIIKKKLRGGRVFEIYSSLHVGYELGDDVLINGEIPMDGKYRLSWFEAVFVKDGKITVKW